MNYSIIRYILGWIVLLQGIFMAIPAVVSVVYAEGREALSFFGVAVVCAAIGALMIVKKPKNRAFYAREGFVVTACSWIVMSLLGALPFFISGAIPSFFDALFESVSGFTTTGATILADVESMPKGVLFWRSFSHWIGGMGVLVFMLAILPMAGGHSIYLMKAESTGPSVSKLVPNMRKTASWLYTIYISLTVLQFVLLVFVGKMPLFDAICSAMGTAGTGGFGVRNDSFAGYTIAAQVITTVFMVLFGVNFGFYFLLMRKRFKEAFAMREVRWYMVIYILLSAFIVVNLLLTSDGSIALTIHEVFFQTASVMTTTGFATVNFDLWPQFSRIIMLILMCVGACAGSTGGGFKVARLMICVKSTGKELSHLLHPRNVKVVKIDGKSVDREAIGTVHTYLACYVLILIVSTALVALDGFDFTTTFTSSIATFNNIGPGLSEVGPIGNFAAFSNLSKVVFVFNMLLGRLEIFPLLLMMTPATWKK